MCIFAIMNYLRNLFLVVVLIGAALAAKAQRPYFVYIQTESGEPFFVQLSKKNQSSSAVGHLILSGLVNGTYDISLGFPGQNATQQYSLIIEGMDKGYLVKKFENGEWGLVDLQTSATQLAGAVKREAEKAEIELAIAAAQAKKLEEEEALKAEQAKAEQARAHQAKAEQAKADSIKALEKNNDADKVVAAAAITTTDAATQSGEKKEGDESAKADSAKTSEKNIEAGKVVAAAAAVTTAAVVVQNGEKKEATEELKGAEKNAEQGRETAEKQTSGTGNPPSGSGVNGGAAAATVAVGTLSAAEIMKLQEEARRIDAQGKRDSVLNAHKKDSDTSKSVNAAPAFLDIEMTMPADSLVAKEAAVVADTLPKAETAEVAVVYVDTLSAGLKKPEEVKQSSAAVVVPPVVVPAVAVPVLVEGTRPDSSKTQAAAPKNPNCTAEATDADMEMVTMLIKGEKDPDDGLEMAKKGMKIKCVQTAQVRKLALLFEGQEERYRLLDMAYRYTTDRQNYINLADLLSDPYYLNRFKAMLQ